MPVPAERRRLHRGHAGPGRANEFAATGYHGFRYDMTNNAPDEDPGRGRTESDPADPMQRLLTGMARIHFATGGEGALLQIRQNPPDLVPLDAEMPGLGGDETCRQLKADGRARVAERVGIVGQGYETDA